MAQTFLDTAIPIILIAAVFIFFYIKLKLGKWVGKLIEWIKENTKKKHHVENPNTYETIEYE
jgi:hypothetical protein